MSLENISERLSTLAAHPVVKVHTRPGDDDPDGQRLFDDFTKQVDDLIYTAVELTPDDYRGGSEDHKAVDALLNGQITSEEAFENGPPAVQAVAIIRDALQKYQLPINGERNHDAWRAYIDKYKYVLSDEPETETA